ncbi:MAG: SRPBCC family protein [Alphaproteobacteria bacterium]|nr:SRPBCC family protein [Alphaproteobacteria bacterium]
MKTVELKHTYDASPERLWALATDFGALKRVMRGFVTFRDLPTGRTYTGQKFDVQVSLFGMLPWQPYHMEIIACDDASMVLRSSERGAGVTSWRHTLSVTKTDTGGSCLTDHIEIEAGILTFAFAKWARFMYAGRHKPRKALLASGAF